MGNNVVVSALTMKLLFASDYRLLPHPESILVQTALLSSSKREPRNWYEQTSDDTASEHTDVRRGAAILSLKYDALADECGATRQ